MHMAVDVFDLYGSRNPDLTSVMSLVSRILAMEFSIRSSDERGEYYASYGSSCDDYSSGDSYEIAANEIVDEEGSYNIEEDFAEYPTLMTVDRSPRANDIKHRLSAQTEVVFLRRTTFNGSEQTVEYG